MQTIALVAGAVNVDCESGGGVLKVRVRLKDRVPGRRRKFCYCQPTMIKGVTKRTVD